MSLSLNIGSGQRPFEKPWINVDKVALWKPDVIWDAGNPLDPCPFQPDSVNMIVIQHCLEHVGCNGSRSLLGSCLALLKYGGSLLILVPDMWELASMWREGRITDQIYFTNVYGAYMGNEADRHRWGFTRGTLTAYLMSCGFGRVGRFNDRKIPGADIASDRWILGMEAYKI